MVSFSLTRKLFTSNIGALLQFQQKPKWILPVETTPGLPDLISQQLDLLHRIFGGRANLTMPVVIKLKDLSQFPN